MGEIFACISDSTEVFIDQNCRLYLFCGMLVRLSINYGSDKVGRDGAEAEETVPGGVEKFGRGRKGEDDRRQP